MITEQYNPPTGELIRIARKKRGWSQQALCARFTPPIAQAILSDVETGKISPRIKWLRRAADALGVSIHDLIPQEDM